MGTVQLWLIADGHSDMTNGHSDVTESGVNSDNPDMTCNF